MGMTLTVSQSILMKLTKRNEVSKSKEVITCRYSTEIKQSLNKGLCNDNWSSQSLSLTAKISRSLLNQQPPILLKEIQRNIWWS